jgi:hypothetical protein
MQVNLRKHLVSILGAWIASGALTVVCAQQPATEKPGEALPEGFRVVAAGVEHTIDPATLEEEKVSYHDLIRIDDVDPKFGERPGSLPLAKNVRFQHNVWALEFTFRPMRFVEVNVPNERGLFDRKVVWYLLYRVRNTSSQPVKFVPNFVLHLVDRDKYYRDRLIPVALGPIEARERPPHKLLDSVAMSAIELPPATDAMAEEAWGVATWEDVDPRTDEFSVYVQGLTNAYRMEVVPGPDGKRTYKHYRKTLQLNFWFPGDEFPNALLPPNAEVRVGVPDKVAYRWVYR